MRNVFTLLFAMTLIGASPAIAGHDNHHITFINQTSKHLKFEIKRTGPDLHKELRSHTANYQHVNDCSGGGKLKNFEIKVKHGDKYLQKDGKDLLVHRKCGEDLYIWHANGEYHTSDKAPHVQADLSGCNENEKKSAVLFAHGFNDSQKAWGKFATHAEKKGWRVFRTSVSEDGSISKRGHMLDRYITRIAKECKIGKGKLRVVAHSMGGLDSRYIISKGLPSAKYIERIYTIATPHKGQKFAGTKAHTSDAAYDLGITQMKKFNKKYPYRDFKYDGKIVPLLAMRFRCDNDRSDSDGIVKVKRQTYDGAPYSKHIHIAKHANKTISEKCSGVTTELNRVKVLDKILRDHHDGDYVIPSDVEHDNNSQSPKP